MKKTTIVFFDKKKMILEIELHLNNIGKITWFTDIFLKK